MSGQAVRELEVLTVGTLLALGQPVPDDLCVPYVTCLTCGDMSVRLCEIHPSHDGHRVSIEVRHES